MLDRFRIYDSAGMSTNRYKILRFSIEDEGTTLTVCYSWEERWTLPCSRASFEQEHLQILNWMHQDRWHPAQYALDALCTHHFIHPRFFGWYGPRAHARYASRALAQEAVATLLHQSVPKTLVRYYYHSFAFVPDPVVVGQLESGRIQVVTTRFPIREVHHPMEP